MHVLQAPVQLALLLLLACVLARPALPAGCAWLAVQEAVAAWRRAGCAPPLLGWRRVLPQLTPLRAVAVPGACTAAAGVPRGPPEHTLRCPCCSRRWR